MFKFSALHVSQFWKKNIRKLNIWGLYFITIKGGMSNSWRNIFRKDISPNLDKSSEYNPVTFWMFFNLWNSVGFVTPSPHLRQCIAFICRRRRVHVTEARYRMIFLVQCNTLSIVLKRLEYLRMEIKTASTAPTKTKINAKSKYQTLRVDEHHN